MSQSPPERFRLHLYVLQPASKPALPAQAVQQHRLVTHPPNRTGRVRAEPAEVNGNAPRRPPLHLPLLRRSRVRAAAEFAGLMFALPVPPQIAWDATRCWLDCFAPRLAGICDPMFEDANDLLASLPMLQQWLDNWASSNDRAPGTEPPWAVERNIARSEVECVARFIAQRLANDRGLTLEFYTDAGDRTCLAIPPRAALQLPPAATCQPRAECITAKEEFAVYATPTGEEVFVPADVAAHRSGLAPADPRRLREFRMTSATRIESVACATEVADGD